MVQIELVEEREHFSLRVLPTFCYLLSVVVEDPSSEMFVVCVCSLGV